MSGKRPAKRLKIQAKANAPAISVSEGQKESIARALRTGATQLQAAVFAGLTAPQWFELVTQAKQGEGPARELLEYCEQIESQTATLLTSLVIKHAKNEQNPQSWRAAAWLLERRFPDNLRGMQSEANGGAQFTAAQVAALIREIGAVVQETVEDEFTRERIRAKMAEITRRLNGRAG